MAGRDRPPVLQAPEHDLDPFAFSVATLVVFDGFVTRLPPRNTRDDAPVWKDFADPNRIVSAIARKPVGGWQAAFQSPCPGVVAPFARGHEEPDRPSDRIRDGMQLRVQAALRSPCQTATPPFFDRRLEAVRCALR